RERCAAAPATSPCRWSSRGTARRCRPARRSPARPPCPAGSASRCRTRSPAAPAGAPPPRSPRSPPYRPTRGPHADAQLTLPGGEDHGERVRDAQKVAPQALLARLHHRAVFAGAEDLYLEVLRAEVVRQRPGEF